jgi:hypothetical protein
MWSMTLAVEVDGTPPVFHPHVSLRGPRSFAAGTLHLELLDERAMHRHVERYAIRQDVLGTDIPLRPFEAPQGADPDEVVEWRWEIAVESGQTELIRWRRRLAAANGLTAEGEIDLPGVGGELRPKIEEEGIGLEAPWDARDSERLLAGLTADGILDADVPPRILSEHALTGKTVERILIDRGLLSEPEVLTRYAEVSGCEFVDLSRYPIDEYAAARIPPAVAQQHGAIAIGLKRGLLTVAMSDPQRQPWELADLYAATGTPIYIVVATRSDVRAALEARGFDLDQPIPLTGRDVQ